MVWGSLTLPVQGGNGESRITSAKVLNVDANSATLQWTAVPSVTKYKLTYTEDGESFFLVNPPLGYCKRAVSTTRVKCELKRELTGWS